MRYTGWVGLLLAIAVAGPASVRAQVAPESPLFLPPLPGSGLGFYLLDAAGGDIGVLGTFRGPAANWGLRLGIAEDTPSRGDDDDLAVFGGVDFMGGIHRSNRDLPLDIDWLVGVFGSIGNNALISIPFGITAGHRFRGEGVDFVPYATPRVVVDAFFDDDEEGDDDLDLDFAMDLGLDLRFRAITLRFGASLGRDAFGIGIVF